MSTDREKREQERAKERLERLKDAKSPAYESAKAQYEETYPPAKKAAPAKKAPPAKK